MHHFGGQRNFFNFNSDLSGNVEIGLQGVSGTFPVDGQDLLDFMAEIVRCRKIAKLEEATTNELLFDQQEPSDA